MKKAQHGFTLIELILVMVLLAVLATIGIIAWNGVVVSSRDRARENDTRLWATTFETYRGRFIAYPAMPTGDSPLDKVICLGTFSQYSNKCGQYNSNTSTQSVADSGSSSMLTEIAKVGRVPSNSGPAVNSALVGPLVYLSQTTASGTTTVTGKFINFFETNCPSDFTDISSSLPLLLALVLTGLPGGTNAKACALVKTFSYTPN